MILLADSGSTKTEWWIVHEGKCIRQIHTSGINPFFQREEQIAEEMRCSLMPHLKEQPVSSVFFYGAGCAFEEQCKVITRAIQHSLPVKVEVYSDLMAVARALCGNRPGIACILGTGSNSCLYDGKDIVKNISPLGYILGDEGSGAVLGKLLVGDCLKNQLPPLLIAQFMEQYELTPATILERVYRMPFPNRYLATLSRFLGEHLDEPAIYQLVYNSFYSFFLRNVMQYPGYETYPIHFIGSIALHYIDVLREVACSLQLELGTVMQSPMPGLLTYHSSKTL